MSKGGVVGDFGPGDISLPPGLHDRLDPEDPQYVSSAHGIDEDSDVESDAAEAAAAVDPDDLA